MSRLRLNTIASPSAPTSGKTEQWASSGGTLVMLAQGSDGNVGLMPTMHLTSTSSDFTGTDVNTAQPVFNTTEDVITLPSSTSYLMEGVYHIDTTGTTSHTLGILFGGAATLTSIGYWAYSTNAATEVLGAVSGIWSAVATVVNVSAALASATHHSVLIKGIVRINAGGTFIPQYQWSSAPGVAGKTLANSYFLLTPFGSNTAKSVGLWA